MSIQNLPTPYQIYLPRQLLQFDLVEHKATCLSCPMAKAQKFRGDLRCCTYEPFIPNFLVGYALSEGSDELKRTLKAAIENGFSLPIGIVPHPGYQVRFNQRQPKDFGNSEKLLCQYLDQSSLNCKIWAVRGSVCSTYFCKSQFGKAGLQFWEDVGRYLALTEMTVLEECLSLHGFAPRIQNLSFQFLNMKSLRVQGKRLSMRESPWKVIDESEVWDGWHKDKERFYRLCYQWAQKITRKEFQKILPQSGRELENQLKNRVSSFSKEKQHG